MEIINLENIEYKNKAIEVLKKGGLIIFPTETAYGVGVDSTNTEAVTKLLKYKKRPEGKAISIAVYNKEMAKKYVEINSIAENFYKTFLPGPVTVISNSKHNTDARLESENGTLGIRIPNYKPVLDLIENFGAPITATSANISGGKTPYSISDILNNLPDKNKELIDLIIDAGELPKNPPSTVIDTTSSELTILRSGRINPLNTELIKTIESTSEIDTIQIGKTMGSELIQKKEPNLILLSGELGAGKTHFTKGLAKPIGIEQVIKSPTYNYVNEYQFKSGIMYHMDAWRIQSKEDLNSLRFYDWFKPGNIIVIEWPSVIMNLDEQFFDKLNYNFVEFINKNSTQREIRIYAVKNN